MVVQSISESAFGESLPGVSVRLSVEEARLVADYRHILEHPHLTHDMKVGYLVAIVIRNGEANSIADAVQAVSRFVREFFY